MHLDGATLSDDEIGQRRPRCRFDPLLDRHPYTAIAAAGDPPTHTSLKYALRSGLNEDAKTVEYYMTSWSVIQILLHLASTVFNVMLTSTNLYHLDAPISMKDIYLYHGYLWVGATMSSQQFWEPTVIQRDDRIQPTIDWRKATLENLQYSK